MNTFIKLANAAAIAFGIAFSFNSLAQTNMDHGKTGMATTSAAMTDGEVRKVDQDAGKITIKHGDIKHLDMPGMTMVFTAQDKSLLSNVKPGDKIRFMVVNEGGKMLVTAIQPVKQ